MALFACLKLNIAKGTLNKEFLNCIPRVVLRLVPAPRWGRHLADPHQGTLKRTTGLLTVGLVLYGTQKEHPHDAYATFRPKIGHRGSAWCQIQNF